MNEIFKSWLLMLRVTDNSTCLPFLQAPMGFGANSAFQRT